MFWLQRQATIVPMQRCVCTVAQDPHWYRLIDGSPADLLWPRGRANDTLWPSCSAVFFNVLHAHRHRCDVPILGFVTVLTLA